MHIQFFLSSRAMTDFLVFLLLIFIALLFFIIYIICLIVLLLLFFFLLLIFLHNSKKKEVKWKKSYIIILPLFCYIFINMPPKALNIICFFGTSKIKWDMCVRVYCFPRWTGLRIGLSAMSLVRPFAQLHSISFQRYSQNCSFLLSSFESQLRVWANQ